METEGKTKIISWCVKRTCQQCGKHILNPNTGNISPQFHIVHNDLFTTAANSGAMNIDDKGFDEGQWRNLIDSGHEKYIDDDVDREGREIPKPPLHNEWLTKREIKARDQTRKKRWFTGKSKPPDQVKVCFKEEEEKGDLPSLEEVSPNNEDDSEMSLANEGDLEEIYDPEIVEAAPILRRSSNKKNPIKRLMNKQSLYQMYDGSRRNGRVMKSAK